VFEGEWQSTLDLSIRYTLPKFGFMDKGVVLRADVFNVFDEQAAIDYVETGTIGTGIAGNPNYATPSGYQAARSVRLGFDIAF
jgi:outer membrane receptor protein involved in Fe transport